MSRYEGLNREELKERLEAAERVCVMYGWSPVRVYDSDREEATLQLWIQWYGMVGERECRPDRWPDLNDDAIAALAAARRQKRAETLAMIERRLSEG